MNKVFSKVWNESLGQLVVASELANNGTGGATHAAFSPARRRSLAVAVAMLLSTSLPAGSAMASGTNCMTSVGTAPTLTTDGKPNTGFECTGNTNAGLTFSANADGGGNNEGIVLRGKANGGSSYLSYFQGFAPNTSQADLRLGDASVNQAGASTSTISLFADRLAFGSAATAATAQDSTAIGDSAQASANYTNAIGSYSSASAAHATALGSGPSAGKGAAATAAGATAIGANSVAGAKAQAVDALALGGEAVVGTGGTAAIAIGHQASASAARAIAQGQGASASAMDSVALGALATASAENSVALGADSVANRANTVSIGNVGSERQLANLAAGVQDTDAVNIAQLKGVTAALGAGASINADGSIQAPNYALTDANGNAVTANNVGDALTQIDGRVSQNTTNVTNLGDRVTNVEGDVGNLQGDINNLTTQLNEGSVGLVQQAAAGANLTVGAANDGAAVDFTGTAGARVLTGVSAGDLSAASQEAVNGSQLFATNERVSAAEGSITDINTDISTINSNVTNLTTQLNEGSVGLVKQSAASAKLTVGAATDGTQVDFSGTVGARVLAGVAGGQLSGDSQEAVNGAQLFATNERVSAAEGDITTINTNVSELGDRVTTVEGDITNLNNDITTINSNVTNLGDRMTTVEGDVNSLTTQLNEGSVGLVQQSAAGANLTVGAAIDGAAVDFTGTAGARVLTGVSAGDLSAASQEAVNGSQLFATNERVTAAEGDITTIQSDITTINTNVGELGDRVTTVEGDITNLNNDITTINTNVTNLGDRVTNVEGDVGTLQGDLDNLASQLNDGSVGLVQQSAAGANLTVGAAIDGAAVDFTGTAGARVLTGVSAGELSAASQEAVNGSQLFATNERVTTAEGNITNINTSIGGLQGDISTINSNVTTLDGRVTKVEGDVDNLASQLNDGSVGLVQQSAAGANLTVGAAIDGAAVDFTGAAGARVLAGVSAGELSAASQEAVNGSQLFATNERVTAAEGSITTIQGDISTINSNVTTLDGRVTNVEGDVGTLQGDLDNLASQLNDGSVGLVQQSAAGANLTVGAAIDGAAVDFTGTVGARVLTGVAAGQLSADSKEAVNGSQLFATNTRLEATEADITNLQDEFNELNNGINAGSFGLVQQDASDRSISVAAETDGDLVSFAGTSGARTLDGVAIGAVSASSQQAVNGSQLFGLSQSIAAGMGGGVMVNADGSLSAPSYSVGGTTVNTIGDAIAKLDDQTRQNSSAINDLQTGGSGMGGELSGLNDKVSSLDNRVEGLENAIANGNFSDNGLVSANVEGSAQVALATGADSMAAGNASTASGDRSTALGNNSVASGDNSVALGNGSIADRDNTVSVGASGSERQITNVAAGTEDTDAVNVAQLKQTVQYSKNEDGSTNYNHVALGQPGGGPVTMSNVAKGRIAADSSDAINGSQMWDWTVNRDNQLSNASLSHRIDVVERAMQAGVATALAARQAPYVPGKVTYAVGAAGYKSQGALGISSRYTAESGRWSLESGFSRNGDGTGVYVGVSGVLGD